MNNIQQLQKETIDILKASSVLVQRVKRFIEAKQQQHYQEMLLQETRKMTNAEVFLPMIAPMNAGKSTVINAIIGTRLLPSHNQGMTTLPTEIELCQDAEMPTLILTEATQNVFQTLVDNLKTFIATKGTTWIDEQIEEYSYLTPLVLAIQEGEWDHLLNEMDGQQRILAFLEGMNHIIRLCILMGIDVSAILNLQDYPRIIAPFKPFSQLSLTKSIGKLVLIDAPGANEGHTNPQIAAVLEEILYHVMARQLALGSLIITLVDFTDPNSAEALKIMQAVVNMASERGADNVYVLYNKFDHGGSGEQDLEQIQKSAGKKFKGTTFNPKQQVFGISGLQALAARAFQYEFAKNHHLSLRHEVVVRLFEARYKRGAKKHVERATIQQAQQVAEELWEESEFQPFLETVIERLIENALPVGIRSALGLTQTYLKHISDAVRIQRETLSKTAEEIIEYIRQIEKQLRILAEHRKSLGHVDIYKEPLRQQIDIILWAAFQDKELPYEIKRMFDYSETNTYYWDREDFSKGKETIEEIAGEKLQKAYRSALDRINREMRNVIEKIRTFLAKNTEPIIQEVRSDLQHRLNIQLSPINVTFHQDRVSVSKSVGFDYVSEDTTRWEKVKTFFVAFTWTKEKFIISKRDFERQFEQKMNSNYEAIQNAVKRFIDNELDAAITRYFEEMDEHIERYKASLKKSLDNLTLDYAEKQELAAELDEVSPNLEELLMTIGDLQQKLQTTDE